MGFGDGFKREWETATTDVGSFFGGCLPRLLALIAVLLVLAVVGGACPNFGR